MQHYINQHRILHRESRQFRGRALLAHIDRINVLLDTHRCHSILDYGCGKAQCWPAEWQGRITGYDPAYAPYSTRPQGQYDMVICTDVMEHIPASAVDWVIRDIFAYRRVWTYINIATFSSAKLLPDGTNKHVTVRPREWWDQRLAAYDRYTVLYT